MVSNLTAEINAELAAMAEAGIDVTPDDQPSDLSPTEDTAGPRGQPIPTVIPEPKQLPPQATGVD